ncbi:MAG: response regulator [Candidatus Omnitrophica bacterium]|nr:response regulator [Candidatus Omnitrophota bacterium]
MEYTDPQEILSGVDTQQISERPSVLVIDDEIGPRESLRILLKDQYFLAFAQNGEEGISILKSSCFDAVILDLRMPGKSGIETLEEIRKFNADIPVIILTGYGTLELAQKAVHLNIFEFVSKPFDVNEIKDIVRRAIERNRISRLTNKILQQLQKLNTDLENRIEELEKFAVVGKLSAEMLHEINNPLTIILGYVQILLGEIMKKNQVPTKEAEKYLKVVENEVKRCQKIAKTFLDVSKKDYKHAPVNINELLENMVSFFKDNPIAKNIDFLCEFDSNIPLVLASSLHLQQVFTNLFMNAIDAIDAKGTITITTKTQQNKVIIKISDTGRGMPEEVLKKIFIPFFTTKSEKSTGIGLTISKKIIEAHKGEIHAESQQGKGSTFTVILPVNSANA